MQIDERHGGPYDRGSADAYYGRESSPHYFKGATYQSEKIEIEAMSEEEIRQYNLGYNQSRDNKDWGDQE